MDRTARSRLRPQNLTTVQHFYASDFSNERQHSTLPILKIECKTLARTVQRVFEGSETFFTKKSSYLSSLSLFIFSFIFSLLFHLLFHFPFHLLSSFSSLLSSSLLSALLLSFIFSCLLVLYRRLLLSLSLSVSLSLCLSLSPCLCCVCLCCVVCVVLCLVCWWSWCVCVLCVVRHAEKTWENPYLASRASPCMPAPRAHVLKLVRVVPVHTGTF